MAKTTGDGRGAMFSRRWFIGGAASLGAMAGGGLFAAPGAASAAGAKLRFGVLSDIHICNKGDEEPLRRALAHFRDAGVDGVLVAGDIADSGRFDQLKLFADTWNAAFPGGRGRDGRRVEKLFVYGNHDMFGWKWDKANKALHDTDPESYKEWGIGWGDNRAKFWEELFGEKYEPIWMKQVNGYAFIGGHWVENDAKHGKCGGIEIEEFMAKHGKELDPSLPFFYTQHPHPADTCIGPWAWGHDDGRSTRALSPFPNAVAFSGHSHYTLTDERTVWQGAFTSINTSSLRYSSTDYAMRENMDGNSFGDIGDDTWRRKAMRSMKTSDGKQGMVVSVYGDRIAIARREFVTGKSLGDDWVIPLPCAESKPFAFAERAKKRVAPEFAEGATVSVEPAKASLKDGEIDVLKVSFPAAETRGKCRVFEYEITASVVADGIEIVQLQRRIMAPGFHLPETPEGEAAEVMLARSELPPRGKLRIDVRPVECFGRKGRAVSATVDMKNTAWKA